LYLFLLEHVKYKHPDVWKEAAKLRRSIRQNEKKIRQTTASINKDPGEEHYDLSDYNYNIAKAETQIEEIGSR
jgi:hypothetical protein